MHLTKPVEIDKRAKAEMAQKLAEMHTVRVDFSAPEMMLFNKQHPRARSTEQPAPAVPAVWFNASRAPYNQEAGIAVKKFNYLAASTSNNDVVLSSQHIHEHHHFGQGNLPNLEPPVRFRPGFAFPQDGVLSAPTLPGPDPSGMIPPHNPRAYDHPQTYYPHYNPHFNCPFYGEYHNPVYQPQMVPLTEAQAIDQHFHYHQHYYHSQHHYQYQPVMRFPPPHLSQNPHHPRYVAPQPPRFHHHPFQYHSRPFFHAEGFNWFNQQTVHRAQVVDYDLSALRDLLNAL